MTGDWYGSIPSHWQSGNIRRFAQMKTGHTPSRSEPSYWQNCTIPWFTLADVWQLRDGKRMHLGESEQKISDLGLANSAAELLPAGTVVLSRTASVGFSGIMAEPAATSQDFWNWVCGPDLLPEFLAFTFRAMADEFGALTMGSTHKTIYQPVAAGIRIPVPPLDEQRVIVRHLDSETSRIDHLIDKQERLIARLGERRRVASDVMLARLEWTTPVKAVATLIQTGPFGSQLKAEEYVEGGVPVLNPSHIRGGTIVPDPKVAVSAEKAAELDRHRLFDGDIVIGRRGEMGRCAVVRHGSVGALCGSGSALVRFDQRLVLPEFAALAIGTRRSREALQLASVGSTMDNLNDSLIGRLIMPVPDLASQMAVVNELQRLSEATEQLLARAERFIELAKERRAALIAAAVTGQLDIEGVTA